MKYWRNEPLVKSNTNSEKYTINNNLHDKAEVFFQKSKKIYNRTPWWQRRCVVTTH